MDVKTYIKIDLLQFTFKYVELFGFKFIIARCKSTAR